jgi:hypothetical protein
MMGAPARRERADRIAAPVNTHTYLALTSYALPARSMLSMRC